MGAFDIAVVLDLVDRLTAPLKGPMRQLEQLEKLQKRVELGMNQMFKGAAITAAGAAIAAPLVIASNAASDMNETVSKSDVVFGKSASVVERWSQNTSTAFGLSRQEALESAATLGNLFVSMRIGSADAATMSTKMIGLAGDLASFNNTLPQDAFEAIRSGLVGEVEPLRRYGVNLDDAQLKLTAFKMGLIRTPKIEVLPPAIKAMAAYKMILEQTTTAQGDYGRTADGVANSTRTIQAQIKDAWATIGQNVLPVTLVLVHMVSSLLGGFNQFAQDHPLVAKVLIGTGIAISGVLLVAGSLLVMLGALNVGFANAKGGAKLLADGVKETRLACLALRPMLVAEITGGWIPQTTAQMAMFGGATNLTQIAMQGLKAKIVGAGLAAKAFALGGLRAMWSAALATIPVIIGATAAVVDFTIALLANPITWVVLAVVALGAAIYGVIKFLLWLGGLFVEVFQKITYWAGYAVGKMARFGIDLVMGLVGGIAQAGHIVWTAILNLAGGILKRFRNFFGIRSPSRVFGTMGEQLIDGLTQGLDRRAPVVLSYLSDQLGPNILQALSGAWDRVKGLAGGLWSSVTTQASTGWDQIKQVAGGVGSAVGGVVSRAGQAIGVGSGPANTAATAARFQVPTGPGTGAAIARAAINGLTAGWAESMPGYCSRFVRQVFAKTLGPATAKYFSSSAVNTEAIWRAQGLTKSLAAMGGKAALKAGDVLFQGIGSGGYGHTGIYAGNGMVAQNTTMAGGGKRLLPINSFGTITSVGRLPDAPEPPRPSVPEPSSSRHRPIVIHNLHMPDVSEPDKFVEGLNQLLVAHQ